MFTLYYPMQRILYLLHARIRYLQLHMARRQSMAFFFCANVKKRKEVLPWQETMAWIAPLCATSPERRATLQTPKLTTSDRKPATGTRIALIVMLQFAEHDIPAAVADVRIIRVHVLTDADADLHFAAVAEHLHVTGFVSRLRVVLISSWVFMSPSSRSRAVIRM